MSIIIEMTLKETILKDHKITEVKILEVDIEGIAETTILEEVEVGQGTDNIQVIIEGMTTVGVGQDQFQELVLIDRIRCFKFRKYGHFAKDCPTLQIEKEPEQIQQMYNLDEEQTALKVLATDPYDNLIKASSNGTMVNTQ